MMPRKAGAIEYLSRLRSDIKLPMIDFGIFNPWNNRCIIGLSSVGLYQVLEEVEHLDPQRGSLPVNVLFRVGSIPTWHMIKIFCSTWKCCQCCVQVSKWAFSVGSLRTLIYSSTTIQFKYLSLSIQIVREHLDKLSSRCFGLCLLCRW